MALVSPTEFRWRRWRLREGEFKGYTGPRPKDFPRVVPAAWWVRLAQFLARRKKASLEKPYDGLFAWYGAFLRNPRGGVEDVARMRREAHMYWVACNIGDHAAAEWATVRERARQASVACIPWRRTYRDLDVFHLLEVAAAWNAPACIVNLEDEGRTNLPPTLVREIRDSHRFPGEVAISTVGWIYNDMDCKPVGDWPCLLQMFWGEAPVLQGKYAECEYHAHAQGFKTVRPTWQAYATKGVRPDPAECKAEYDGGFSLYCGDDVVDWKAWGR